MLFRRFPVFLSVLALLSAAATVSSGLTIESGETVQSSSLTDADWPVTVKSGGTLQNSTANKNLGDSNKTLTISGTGNDKDSTTDVTPLGAIYSAVTCSKDQGIYASVYVSGSATTTCNGNGNDNDKRLRFQGNVTGGPLTTYSLGAGETHAGYASSFNIDKLIIAKGNFSFNAEGGASILELQHIFTNGIEVQNGGFMRLWACSQGLSLYSDQNQTTLATVTLNAGGALKVEGGIGKIKANLNVAGNASLNPTYSLEWQAGSITGTGTLTMSGSKLTMDSGTSISAPLTIDSGTLEMKSGSSLSGTLAYGSDLTKINIYFYNGATVTLNDDTTLNSTLKTLSGSLAVAADKTLTVNGVDTSANETKGTITLNAGATLKVKSGTTSKFNADITLTGDANIMVDSGNTNLTVKDINASGKTLTFPKTTSPGKTLTAHDVTAGTIDMVSSTNFDVNSLSANTITFYRANDFKIADTLAVGDGGVNKAFSDTTVNASFTFADGATVKLLNTATSSTISNLANNLFDVNIDGTLNINLTKTEVESQEYTKTLTWNDSKFIGASGKTNKIVKTGDGTLNLNPSDTTDLTEIQLNDGTLGVGGTLNTTLTVTKGTLDFNSGASFTGKIAYGTFTTGSEPSINIKSGASVTLNDDTTLDSTLKTLSGSLAVAADKTVTVNGVDTSANETKGKITLNAGSTLSVTSGTTSKFNADLQMDGAATISASSTTQGNLALQTVTGSGTLTIDGVALTLQASDASISTPLKIESDASLNLAGSTTLNGNIKTLAGELIVVADKTLTVNGVDTSANETKGKITLNADSNLLVKSDTTSKFNADVKLAGDATITLDATTSTAQGQSNLTVHDIKADGKVLTFGGTSFPGGTLTADQSVALTTYVIYSF